MDDKPSIRAMASRTDSEVIKLKGTKILVLVEDALDDVLVVSFNVGSKIFQGALLDVTKKECAYGIVPPGPLIPPDPPATESASAANALDAAEEKTDKLYALKQRHTYFQVAPGSAPLVFGSKQVSRSTKDKSVRMRRLRPRKVLCSHCQGIFNDSDSQQKKGTGTTNSSNADDKGTLPGKNANSDDSKSITGTAGETKLNQRITTRSSKSDSFESGKSDSSEKAAKKLCLEASNGIVLPEVKSGASKLTKVVGGSGLQVSPNGAKRGERMVLRKRKLSSPDHIPPPGSTEKLKKLEGIKQEDSADINAAAGSICSSAAKSLLAKTSPVIKISFANPQGKDTVLKIPPRIQTASDTEEDSSWSLQENSEFSVKNFASTKAARKALKKAKKEAQRKAAVSILSQNIGNGEGALSIGKDKHHHHKHKLKRKRKRKSGTDGENQHDLENTDTGNVFKTSGNSEGWCLRTSYTGDIDILSSDLSKSATVYDEAKSKCFRKKLSINLRRLSAKAYMKCSPKYSIEDDSVVSDISEASSMSVGSVSGSDCGDVPDFPKHSSPLRDADKVKPLMMRISTHNVKRCVLDTGREMSVGDIVWGKIHGFPWWPGKVLALIVSRRDNGATINQQAHVSWFGSSTSSYMPCNQLTPFLDDFKIRYNKKKRGPYKEAIRQATNEAHKLPHKDSHELNLIL